MSVYVRDKNNSPPVKRELSGYRSLRARRFRIIYKINEAKQIIEIQYVGHRKDIYEHFSERAGRSIVGGI